MIIPISENTNVTVRFDRTALITTTHNSCIFPFADIQNIVSSSLDYFEISDQDCIVEEHLIMADADGGNSSFTMFKIWRSDKSAFVTLTVKELDKVKRKLLPLLMAVDLIFEEIENELPFISETNDPDIFRDEFTLAFNDIVTSCNFSPRLSSVPVAWRENTRTHLYKLLASDNETFLGYIDHMLFE